MKRQLLMGILASSFALTFFGSETQVQAKEFLGNTEQYAQTLATSPEWDFEFSNGTITKYVGSGGNVVVPSSINGQQVTKIGELAFIENEEVRSVVLPDTVSEIDEYAFMMCKNLTSITLSASLEKIEKGAFLVCENLLEIHLPPSLYSIGEGAFAQCYSLVEIVIPDSVVILNQGVFIECTSLVKATLSNSITEISSKLFAVCTSLESIIIPDSVESIGSSAFMSCHNLKSLHLGNSLVSIEKGAFLSCFSLESIVFPDSLLWLGEVVFGYCENLKTIKIGSGLTKIPDGTFGRNGNLTTAYIPANVIEVGELAFHTEINGNRIPSPHLVIHGESGSYIESYARNEGIPFVLAETSPQVDTVAGYSDILATNWFAYYVNYVSENGLMFGVNNQFLPNEHSDRGTVAQALANLSKQPLHAQVPSGMTDVAGSTYEEAIAWCLDRGVMTGFNTTYFGTEEPLTREQFATTLRAYSQAMGVYQAPTEDGTNRLAEFEDSWSISFWANESMAWAVENNLMAGFSGNINPQGSVTRAEVAVMLHSFSEKLNQYGGDVPEIEVPVEPDDSSSGDGFTEEERANILKVTMEHIDFLESHLKEANRNFNLTLSMGFVGSGFLNTSQVREALTNLEYSVVYAEMAVEELRPLVNGSNNYGIASLCLEQYIILSRNTLAQMSSYEVDATNYAYTIDVISDTITNVTMVLNQALDSLN